MQSIHHYFAARSKSAESTHVRAGVLRQSGFTAIELMVTITIMAVLTTLAAPSFTYLLQRWRIAQTADVLKSSLHYARAEAIKRGGGVFLNKAKCDRAPRKANWDCGWYVCAAPKGKTTCADTHALQRYSAPAGLQISRADGIAGASIKFNRWGLVSGRYVGFSIVPHGENTNHPATRGVCMSSGGRIRVIPRDDVPCNT